MEVKKNTLAAADILLLQQQLRAKLSLTELGYFLVNSSHKISPYQIGIFYHNFQGNKGIQAISGLPMPIKTAPFHIWLQALFKHIVQQNYSAPQPIKTETIPANLSTQWQDFLPTELLWLPLINAEGDTLGGLLLARADPWQVDEVRIFQYWSGAIAHAVELLAYRKKSIFKTISRIKSLLVFASILGLAWAAFLPVSLSILAQTEVVAKNPTIIRAPIEGVIAKVLAKPNTSVKSAELLITLDDTRLKSRLNVAVQELEISKAEYRRAEQVAVTDRTAAAEIPILAAKIQQNNAEVAYVNSLLNRVKIHANTTGIAIIPDAYELEGKPVKLGERLLIIATPEAAELEMWLAVGDSITLPEHAKIELFLNVNPETSYPANLNYVNFQAEMSPEGLFAFRARANFTATNQLPRIGLRGVAKIYGAQVPVYYYLLRRPYAAIRQWLGL